MNTAVINIKVDPKVKTQAQAIAEKLGFSLSSLINAYLREVIRKKAVNFSLNDLKKTSNGYTEFSSDEVIDICEKEKTAKKLKKLSSLSELI